MFFPLAFTSVTTKNRLTGYTVTGMRVTCQEFIGGYMPRDSRLEGRPAGAVNLIGGRLCLDFVNSVGARRFLPSRKMSLGEEKLNDYLDLLAWGRHAGALTSADA